MSADNIALMNLFVDAVSAGEPERLPPHIHPDFELLQSTTVPYAGVYKGPEGFLHFISTLMDSYEPLDLKPGEIFVAPSGALVVEITLAGNLKSSGKRVETTILELWEFEDGKLRRVKPHYFDPNPID